MRDSIIVWGVRSSFGRKNVIKSLSRRVFTFILIIAALVSLSSVQCFAVGQSSNGRIINVVYDDSRSMYLNNETRWCQAKYAMEVFCAMMDEEDVMNIYAMNRSEVLTLKGNDPDRVQKVHTMTSKYSGTPFSTVTRAGKALSNESSNHERWLVVLTDGSFDNTTQSTVQSTLDNYNTQGIKTVYLAIGNSAVELYGNTSKGAYAEKAATTSEILSKVTSIANQIFEHQVLSGNYISNSDGKTILNIDIPTDQIVIFAQGENASVSSLTLNGKTITPTSSYSVKHSGDVMPLNSEELSAIKVDTSLYGVVSTFDAGDTPFESGQFSVKVSNATTVEYYYRPGVTVNCELILNGKEVQTNDKLYAGNYEVTLNFTDPFSGKRISSELLSSAVFSLSVTNNDSEQVVYSKTGSIVLEEGNVDISAIAELPGNVFLTSQRSYTVLPEPVDLKLELTPDSISYSPDQLGDKGDPIILRATDSKTAQPLSQEEWEQTVVTADEIGGIKWTIAKGQEVSTWELRPISGDGTLTSIQPGEYEIAITAAYEIGGATGYGISTIEVSMDEYAGNALDVQISSPTGMYDLNDMSDPEAMLVSVMYEDPQTGQFLPLTEEMWNSFAITASSERRMSWNITKGEKVGTWNLTPKFYLDDPVLTESGQVEVLVSVDGASEIYSYSGSGTQQAEFGKLSWINLVKALAPRVLAAAAILWLIIGYIKKKRLHTRGLDPRCRFKGTTSPKQKISKDFLSVVLPYVPEKATVRCHKSAFQCNFPDLRIQATGRRSFKIINRTMPLATTKICGEVYSDMDTLKKRNFALGSFDITSIDQRTRKTLGTFSFR